MPAIASAVVVNLVYIGRRPRREKFGLYKYIRNLAQFSSRNIGLRSALHWKAPGFEGLFSQTVYYAYGNAAAQLRRFSQNYA